MYTEQLDYFMLAYRLRSFSAAAKQVPMSSQGLTKSIRALENELGVTLFVVDANGGLKPTPFAEELAPFATQFEENRKRLAESFERIRARERHEIRLGTSLGIIGLLGPDFLESFHSANPDIRVTVNEDSDDVCEKNLARGAYDLAFTLAPYNPDFETEKLFATRVCFWVPSCDDLAQKRALSVADLAGHTIAIPGKDYKCYRSLLSTCQADGIEISEIVPSSEIFWLYEYALHGNGLGFTIEPHTKLAMFQTSDAVVALPCEGLSWRFGISHVKSRNLTPHEEAFRDYAIEFARTIAQGGIWA
ncbi:LysR family transcriptional regulator [Raoultibacter phocaeensis]|uniref:LysR family transcriptional regulator n=1 Tax=Raoultibacter phocaeensis TaxID=2479841 RepID=UPI0015D5CE75|nr:LysR family transcriptional regulator [Raoultibacter phocaeensis]